MDELDRIRRLRDEYESALDKAERLRNEYHAAIVELHRSGRTLRDIAEGLGVSHQRIHQIVAPAGAATRRRGAILRAGGVAGVLALVLAGAFLAGLRLGTSPPGAHQISRAEPRPVTVVFTRCWSAGSARPPLALAQAAYCARLIERSDARGASTMVVIDPRTGRIEAMASAAGSWAAGLLPLERPSLGDPVGRIGGSG